MTALSGAVSGRSTLRRYPAARDWWISVIIWGATALTVGAGIEILTVTDDAPITPIVGLFLMLAVAFMLWCYFGTWYELDHRELRARCGPLSATIPLDRIDAVVPSRNPASSMALSLDRLAVVNRTGHLEVLIAPRDREAFLRDLAWLGPGLEYADGAVRRKARARR
jgi:type VI protein secretion system component VasK